MTDAAKVTIGLPVFNGEKYLASALGSIINQDYKSLTILISDNASTDKTPSICKHFSRLDPRIKYYRQSENIGANGNTLFLANKATDEHYLPASHDDIFSTNYVSANMDAITATGALVSVGSQVAVLNPHGVILDLHKNLCTLSMSKENAFQSLANRHLWTAYYGLTKTSFFISEIESLSKHFGNPHGPDVLMHASTIMQGDISCSESTFYFRQFPRTPTEYQKTLQVSGNVEVRHAPMASLFANILTVIDQHAATPSEALAIKKAFHNAVINSRVWHAELLRERAVAFNNNFPEQAKMAETFLIEFQKNIEWDEQRYLSLHPDVAEAVRIGGFSSGLQHYVEHGRLEGRVLL